MKSICLIVTSCTDFSVIRRFFKSLNDQEHQLLISIFFVNQNENKFEGFDLNDNVRLNVIEINKLTPLSKARNIALSHANLSHYDFVAFPDDDCWYNEKLLSQILSFFDSNNDIDILCTNVKDPTNNKTYGGRPTGVTNTVTISNVFSYPISVGIFIKLGGRNINEIYFDELLGAGGEIGSGEETELVYRLIKSNNSCVYNGDIFVYHPVVDNNYTYQDISKYYKYAIGFGFLIKRMVNNKDYGVIIYYLYILLRASAGILLSFNNEINRKVYLARLKGMISGFFRNSK